MLVAEDILCSSEDDVDLLMQELCLSCDCCCCCCFIRVRGEINPVTVLCELWYDSVCKGTCSCLDSDEQVVSLEDFKESSARVAGFST